MMQCTRVRNAAAVFRTDLGLLWAAPTEMPAAAPANISTRNYVSRPLNNNERGDGIISCLPLIRE